MKVTFHPQSDVNYKVDNANGLNHGVATNNYSENLKIVITKQCQFITNLFILYNKHLDIRKYILRSLTYL